MAQFNFFLKICEKVLAAKNGHYNRKERPELGEVSLDQFLYTYWLASGNDI